MLPASGPIQKAGGGDDVRFRPDTKSGGVAVRRFRPGTNSGEGGGAV